MPIETKPNQSPTMLGTVNHLGHKLLTALPPAFLVLCGVNIVFVIGLLWSLDRHNLARERILSQILTVCLARTN